MHLQHTRLSQLYTCMFKCLCAIFRFYMYTLSQEVIIDDYSEEADTALSNPHNIHNKALPLFDEKLGGASE